MAKITGSEKPVLIDLFCGGGAAGIGYAAAGFEVIGVDYVAQPTYPFEFHKLEIMELLGGGGAQKIVKWTNARVIHASPPCQSYSAATMHLAYPRPKLIEPLRPILESLHRNGTGGTGGGESVVYVIENVPGAPLYGDRSIMLCGTMFGKNIRRHRIFESNFRLIAPPFGCDHPEFVYDPKRKGEGPLWKKEMIAGYESGKIWEKRELTQAIPPYYTDYIGTQILKNFEAPEVTG